MDCEKEKWLTEYKEAGEEVRYRDRILHNSYYLLVISFAAFAGSTLNLASGAEPFYIGIILISIFAAAAFAFLSAILHIYNEKRIVAMFRRQQVGERLGDLTLQRATHPNFRSEINRGTRSEGITGVGPALISVIVGTGSGGWLFVSISISIWRFGNIDSIIAVVASFIACCLYIFVFIQKIIPKTHPTRKECLTGLS